MLRCFVTPEQGSLMKTVLLAVTEQEE